MQPSLSPPPYAALMISILPSCQKIHELVGGQELTGLSFSTDVELRLRSLAEIFFFFNPDFFIMLIH